MMTDDISPLGEILQWPGGYAMTLGRKRFALGVLTCCAGHETPWDAKAHGLIRLIAIAGATADRDVAAWGLGVSA